MKDYSRVGLIPKTDTLKKAEPVSRFSKLNKAYWARLEALRRTTSRLDSIRASLLGTAMPPSGSGSEEDRSSSLFGDLEFLGEKIDNELNSISLSLDEIQDALQF